MKPLTERQEQIVLWLDEHGPAKHSSIAYGIGMNKLGRIVATGGGMSRGSAYTVMNPAQRIISSMIGLDRRGLVRPARDYKSGLTEEGKKVAAEIRHRTLVVKTTYERNHATRTVHRADCYHARSPISRQSFDPEKHRYSRTCNSCKPEAVPR